MFCLSVVVFFRCLRPLHNHLHGFVVVALNLQIRNPAVALSCGNLTMPEKVLNGSQMRIGVEKLSGHGMAKPMTGDIQLTFARIGFHPLLDAAHG